MTLAKCHLLVSLIQAGNSRLAHLIGILHNILGLSAATDTTAGTGHHFDKMILLTALFHTLDHLTRIGSSVNNGNVHFHILYL